MIIIIISCIIYIFIGMLYYNIAEKIDIPCDDEETLHTSFIDEEEVLHIAGAFIWPLGISFFLIYKFCIWLYKLSKLLIERIEEWLNTLK